MFEDFNDFNDEWNCDDLKTQEYQDQAKSTQFNPHLFIICSKLMIL